VGVRDVEEMEGDIGYKWTKCLWKDIRTLSDTGFLFLSEVSVVQRTFEMAHLTALYSTPSRCHHLHTSRQTKMDGENQCHRDERFIKVTLSSKLLKPLHLVPVVGILTYQRDPFLQPRREPCAFISGDRAASWLIERQLMTTLTIN